MEDPNCSSEAASSASWSRTVWVFISGIFFGTFIGVLLYWKTSLWEKFRALLGPQDTASAPPMEATDPESLPSTPSSSSHRRVYKYDVFISFRGSDTRNNITAHLYHCLASKGISTFKHDEGLGVGQQAIEDSRISIVVFSRDYAASTWCLEELAAIANCHQELGQPVIPIYYGVDPSEVRHQKGPYQESFALHEERFKEDPAKVCRWRSAMKVLSTLSGWDLRNKLESKEIEKIAGKIVQDLTEQKDKFSSYVEDLVEIQPPTDVHKYDVFLSFRGTDTRNNFIDHLRNCLVRQGISTFQIDEMVEKGEPISSQLLQAIKDSRISIIVFTRDYANSVWCLEEMAAIADCYQELRQTVIPVFYDVRPSDVRNQTGPYEKALVSHTKRFRKDSKKVHRWKKALTDLANLSGFEIRDKPEFIEIERIVSSVIDILGHKLMLKSINDLVGIQARVEELEKLLKLSSEDDDFQVLGICGMGGIGKTTHARVLYDKIFDQFDACCFIENIREIYRDGGPIAVQKQILLQTLNEKNLDIDSPFGISGFVRRRLSQKRVLIVLDDVDRLEQLDIIPKLLGKGSRIIVTTRDRHILKVYGADVYTVRLLNDNEAHELFLRKAFNSDIPSSSSHMELIPAVLKHAQGLPLAITVLGSFLCNRDAIEWKYVLEGLRKVPEKQIMDILKMSFDSLEENEKAIFLHIACFFHGQREEYVQRILDSCELYPRIGIQVMLDKSLITIKNGEIHMHEMLQELGRNIVREENLMEPGKRSRLWHFKDFEHVLMTQMGADNVEAIVLDEKEDFSKCNQFSIEGLSKMRNLMLLILYHKNFSGSPDYLSNKLRYLLWNGYPFSSLPLFEPYSSLVELNLPNSSIKQLWEGPKDFPYLKRVDLSNSKDLLETPNFKRSLNLEVLDLTGCTKLRLVHPSIGLLTKLVYLSLRGCTNLENMPDFMGLSNLKHLELTMYKFINSS